MKCLVFSCVLLPFFLALPCFGLEPLKDSTAEYIQAFAKARLKKGDKNSDGKLDEPELSKAWQREKRYDINRDGGLDYEELKAIPLKYIDSPGRKLLNVSLC